MGWWAILLLHSNLWTGSDALKYDILFNAVIDDIHTVSWPSRLESERERDTYSEMEFFWTKIYKALRLTAKQSRVCSASFRKSTGIDSSSPVTLRRMGPVENGWLVIASPTWVFSQLLIWALGALSRAQTNGECQDFNAKQMSQKNASFHMVLGNNQINLN